MEREGDKEAEAEKKVEGREEKVVRPELPPEEVYREKKVEAEKEVEKREDPVLRPELPPSEIYREKASILLRNAFVALLVIFSVSTASCIALLFLNAFKVTSLSDQALTALVTATVAEIAGLMIMVIIVIKGLLPKP
jgi:uncharacterized membrane protein YcjF (UPF0283 family)